MTVVEGRACVLVVAAGAAWESRALAALDRPGLVVLKRCMDVTDLLAVAAAGQAQVAVVSADAPGLDGSAVEHLRAHGVSTVAVTGVTSAEVDAARLAALGVGSVVVADRLDGLPEAVLDSAAVEGADEAGPAPVAGGTEGRVLTVWGPTGAPGRTTVALGIAAELGRRGVDPLLLDVDPWGGAVAQHLGVLDEVSGLLASARLGATTDELERFTALQRRVGDLRVLTGLPRSDRWGEVRRGTVERLVGLGRQQGPVVLDTGFSLEDDGAADWTGRPGRNAMTLEAIELADDLIVVGSADPVGLSRLARGLVELGELTERRAVHVVVNRMRGSLGWQEREVAGMVEGFARVLGIHFLPEDRPAVDRAMLAGRSVVTQGEGPLARSLAELVDAVTPTVRPAVRRGIRRRTTGRARRP